jgi:hypothetical protein
MTKLLGTASVGQLNNAQGRRHDVLVWCRVLAARQVGEYLPWQVAGPHLVRMKNLLALDNGNSRCADAFQSYVLDNVSAPFMAGLSQDASFGYKCDSSPPVQAPLQSACQHLLPACARAGCTAAMHVSISKARGGAPRQNSLPARYGEWNGTWEAPGRL